MKKSILFLGRSEFSLDQITDALRVRLGGSVSPVFIPARDGVEAVLKSANQKFDAVVLDPRASRLQDSGFFRDLKTNKNLNGAGLVVLSPETDWQAPAELGDARVILNPPLSQEKLVEALFPHLQIANVSKAQASSSFAVDAKVLNSIVKAAQFVCGQFGIKDIQLRKPEVKTAGALWRGDVGASIAINSRRFQGTLLISFDEKMYLRLVSNMLGEEQTVINSDNADAVGEVTNMILGNAKSDFTEYDIGMSLPVMLKKGVPTESPTGSAEILIAGESSEHCVYIQVVAFPVAQAA